MVVRVSVALMNRVANDVLHAFRLQPRLSHFGSTVGVGAHEGVKDTKLVELDPEVILGHSEEARQVVAREYNSGKAQGKNHVHGEGHVRELSLRISAPHSTVALRAKEERTSQHERSLLTVISLQKAAVG